MLGKNSLSHSAYVFVIRHILMILERRSAHDRNQFTEVDRVFAFRRLAWTRFGPKVVVGTALYILQNHNVIV